MKAKAFLLALSLLVFTLDIRAQDPESFNKVYTQIYLETAQKDINKALERADSLFHISTTPLFKVKSLMLSASLYQQKEDLRKAIEYGEQANTIIETTDAVDWKVRIYGFLGTQYRLLKLYDKSKMYSEKALILIPDISNKEAANSTQGLIFQELAYYEMDQKNYTKAIAFIRKSQKYFSLVTQNKNVFMLHNAQLLGLNYYKLKNFDEALHNYQQGLQYVNDLPYYYLTGLIYNGIAATLIAKDSLDNVKQYIGKAEEIAAKTQYLQLKNDVYSTLQLYYTKKKELDKLEKIKQLQDTVKEKILVKNSSSLNSIFTQLDNQKKRLDKRNVNVSIALSIAILLSIAGGIGFIGYRRKQKTQFELYKKIVIAFHQKEQERLLAQHTMTQEVPVRNFLSHHDATVPLLGFQKSNNAKETNSILMSEETMQKLLIGLDEFESSNLYLNNKLSLSYLSSYLSTNTKYLSHVINVCKKKDFNNYVNDLRIEYIISKLNTDTEWRRYKISVLAKECGFSSHSKFTTVFKATTGLSPSVFIQYLNKEEGDNS